MLGFTVDTNGAYLAQRLAEQGIAVVRRTAVGDDVELIAAAVREALERTGAVITTGGLGPTSDDVTRDAVAQVFGRALQLDQAHLEWMRERWHKRFGRDLPDANARQAMIPAGGRRLENRHGSALGALVEDDRGWVAMLPGVPRELRGMTDDTLVPLLLERRGGAGTAGARTIRSLTLRTTGVAESLLADIVGTVPALAPVGADGRRAAFSLAYLPGVDGVDLRLTVRAPDPGTADRELGRAAAALREVAGKYIYGQNDDDLARVVLERCRASHYTLCVAESCTGGMLGARITAIPGSSDVFLGGVIAYADEVKTRDLGVPATDIAEHGAVSEAVVRHLAIGAQRRFEADVALAITGIAGPDGGTEDKPVGTVWICAAIGDQVESRKIHSWGDRQEVRYRAAQAALELARRTMARLASR